MLDKYMRKFSAWFSSTSGVVETFVITFTIVLVEHIWPSIDPQGFMLLYWLTVYSGITQPVLAYAANTASTKSEEVLIGIGSMLHKQEETDATILQLAKNQTDMMKALLAIAKRLEHHIGEIAEDVEDIKEAHE